MSAATLPVSVTDALIELLLAQSSIATLVGARIEPLALPNETLFPALVVSTISQAPAAPSHDGPGTVRARVQIDAWARGYREIGALDRAVLDFLVPNADPGSPIGPVRRRSALGVELQAELRTIAEETWERDTSLYRVSRDYFIWASA